MLDFLITYGFSLRHACRLLEWNRSTFQYQPRLDPNAALRKELRAFSESKRRRGSRKAHNFLTRKGIAVSRNRVHRLWKQERLQVKKRVGKKRKPPDKHATVPLVAEHPGHVWSYDFLFDATVGGGKLKILTIGDDFTRECHAIEVGTGYPLGDALGDGNRRAGSPRGRARCAYLPSKRQRAGIHRSRRTRLAGRAQDAYLLY